MFGISPVVREGDVVFTVRGKRKALWVSCPDCGPQPPAIGWIAHLVHYGVIAPSDHSRGTYMVCSACGQDAPYRKAILPREKRRGTERCNQRCLNGKISCRCRCEGRCHGEGKCYCKVAS